MRVPVKYTPFINYLRTSLFNIKSNGKLCGRYCCSTAPISSRTGFDNYDLARKNFKSEIPDKFNFTRDIIDVWAKKEKENGRKNPAFWFMYENGKQLQWSFQELSERTKRTARLLQDHCGLQRNDNMIVILPKLPEFWLVNLAAVRAGIILCPASMMLTAKDLKYRIETYDPKCIIAHDSVTDTVDQSVSSRSSLKTKVIVSPTKKKRDGWLNFDDLFEKSSSEHEAADTSADDSMMVFFTSGTTGQPKMVEHTHASYGYSLRYTGRYIMDVNEDCISWNLSDTGWAKTAYGNIFGPWSEGSCVFVHEMPRYSPSTVLEVLSKVPIDTICAAPTMFRMLVQEDLSGFKPMSLAHCLSGGETLNSEVINAWYKCTNVRIYEGYGQTETVMLSGMFKCLEYRAGSIGKPPPGVELAILDENHRVLGPYEEGQISVKKTSARAAGIFKGYRGEPERTASRYTDEYFLTGDLAYYDKDGYFWFVGRVDDLINSAGYRIGPSEVESAIMEHPYVVEVGVTSSPDELRGEIVTAHVVLQEKHRNTDKELLTKEIQEHVKKTTAPYKYPRKINFFDELPKTISGKIKRSELRRREWAQKK